jgi:hypothetical protein
MWLNWVDRYENWQARPMKTWQALTFFIVVHVAVLIPFVILIWRKHK